MVVGGISYETRPAKLTRLGLTHPNEPRLKPVPSVANGYPSSFEVATMVVPHGSREAGEGNRLFVVPAVVVWLLVNQPPVTVFRRIHVRSFIPKRLIVQVTDLVLVFVSVNFADYVGHTARPTQAATRTKASSFRSPSLLR